MTRVTSGFGTSRIWRDVRLESTFGGQAEVGLRGRQVSFWPPRHEKSPGRRFGVSTYGGGDDVPGSNEDEPNSRMPAANRSSCKGYPGRSSDSLRSDKIGRTSPDCR